MLAWFLNVFQVHPFSVGGSHAASAWLLNVNSSASLLVGESHAVVGLFCIDM